MGLGLIIQVNMNKSIQLLLYPTLISPQTGRDLPFPVWGKVGWGYYSEQYLFSEASKLSKSPK